MYILNKVCSYSSIWNKQVCMFINSLIHEQELSLQFYNHEIFFFFLTIRGCPGCKTRVQNFLQEGLFLTLPKFFAFILITFFNTYIKISNTVGLWGQQNIFQICGLLFSWGYLGQDQLMYLVFKYFGKRKKLKKDLESLDSNPRPLKDPFQHSKNMIF